MVASVDILTTDQIERAFEQACLAARDIMDPAHLEEGAFESAHTMFLAGILLESADCKEHRDVHTFFREAIKCGRTHWKKMKARQE